ncbi:TPA: hypothetical protein TXJ16_000997 [Streptococcus suis]|nr:hypothetical protein [Streptococcus suis]
MMKCLKRAVLLLVSCMLLVGCVVNNNSVAPSGQQRTDIYRLVSDEADNAWTYFSMTHEQDAVHRFKVYYEVELTDAYLGEIGASSPKEAGDMLEELFYEYSLPELAELETVDGVEVASHFPRERVWRLVIDIDPAIADFNMISQIVGEGDLEMLADIATTTASEFATIFYFLGFEKMND